MSAAEVLRSDLINRIDLRAVGENRLRIRHSGNKERYTGRQRTVQVDPCFEGNTGRPTGGRAEALSQAILIYSNIRRIVRRRCLNKEHPRRGF
jgi:hypothetical protein